jgi:beta-lactamase class A
MNTNLEHRFAQITASLDATVGIALHHMESGQQVMFNADDLFVLASVVKVPVLVEAFAQLRDNRLRLHDRWSLEPAAKDLGSGILAELDDGLSLTVRDLLTLMTVISDNTATDMLMERLGIDNISHRMHSLGLKHIHVSRTLHDIFADMLPSADADQDRAALARWEMEYGVRKDGFAYRLGPDNNVASPRDMTRLMAMIFRGELLDRAACDSMLEILLKQQLNDRLPRFLPAGTKVAHKTGTLSGVRNDIGVIYVSEHSHIALSVFIRWDHDSVRTDPLRCWKRFTQLDTAMGQIALAAFQTYASPQGNQK